MPVATWQIKAVPGAQHELIRHSMLISPRLLDAQAMTAHALHRFMTLQWQKLQRHELGGIVDAPAFVAVDLENEYIMRVVMAPESLFSSAGRQVQIDVDRAIDHSLD